MRVNYVAGNKEHPVLTSLLSLWYNYIYRFTWLRNGKFFNIAKDPRVRMRRRSGTLDIDFHRGGRPEDYEGEYQCLARNDIGTAISNKIFLQVSSEYHLHVLSLHCLLEVDDVIRKALTSHISEMELDCRENSSVFCAQLQIKRVCPLQPPE